MPPFKYTPLQAGRDEIRLCRLLPGPFSANLEIEIIHEDVSSNPIYEALSYVWGTSERTNDVVVRTQSGLHNVQSGKLDEEPRTMRVAESRESLQTLSVTQNLDIALRYLRCLETVRVLWIDAICINQDDLDERSERVSDMASVYSKAQRVLVWLGPESENSPLAIKALKDIEHDIVITYSRERMSMMIKPGSRTDQLERSNKASRAEVLSWVAIRDLLGREWFTRLWVFQEIRLASQAIIVVGNDEMGWNGFTACVYWLENEATKPSPISDIIGVREILRLKPLIFQSKIDGRGVLSTLEQLLEQTKHSKCLDPRDRIYSILSLLTAQERLHVKPDYSRSVEDVFKEVVLHRLKNPHGLEILRYCRYPRSATRLNLPSWAPDLSVPNLTSRLIYCDSSQYTHKDAIYNEVDNSLQIQGFLAATINHVSASISFAARLPEILAICHTWEPSDLHTAPYVAGGSLLEAFLSALMCRYVNGLGPRNADRRLSLENCKKAYVDCVVEGKIDSASADFARILHFMLPGRAFFTTQEGYIGLCPAGARPGDRVTIVLTSHAPILMRPVSNKKEHFQVGGECYVPGLMNGEGLLGPLHSGWSVNWVFLSEVLLGVHVNHENKATQQDPRLDVLPPGWRFRYGPKEDLQDAEFDQDGNMLLQWFENIETGEVTEHDPRLRIKDLKDIGVDIQDLILV